jgi:hypothetical protein
VGNANGNGELEGWDHKLAVAVGRLSEELRSVIRQRDRAEAIFNQPRSLLAPAERERLMTLESRIERLRARIAAARQGEWLADLTIPSESMDRMTATAIRAGRLRRF